MAILKNFLVLIICLTVTSAACAAVDVSASLRAPKKDTTIELVKKYIVNEQYTDAMLELNKLLASKPNDPEVYVLAAKLLRMQGEHEEAEKMAREAQKLDYKSSEAYLELGYAYMDMMQTVENKREIFTQAFDHFFMAAQYDPSNPLPHVALAEAYYMNMQMDRSTDEILKARELSFGNAEAYYKIGQYYYTIGDFEKSRQYIKKSMEAGRDKNFRAYYEMGIIYEQDGEIKNAQEQYLQALKLKPDFTEAQERLDSLIKVKYKENLAEKSKPTDILKDVDPDLRYLMKADYSLMLDQFTQAQDIYVMLLEKNPQNTAAISGLAELYYSKWKGGYITSKNFTSNAMYLIKADINKKNEIALLKFQMLNEPKIPEKVRQRLINLSITESFEFYDLLNEVRAEFLLGNYEECHTKLLRLMDLKLSNYEKFKILKHLTYDNNYYEAFLILKELKKTYYHNEEIEPVEKRIKAKFITADEKVKKARELYDSKEYVAAMPYFEEVINYFPTYKPAYLHYAKALDIVGDYEKAYENLNIYYRLYALYPDKNPEISVGEIKAMIQDLYSKMKGQINKK